jgi:ribose-phosphate pyrophosphokinase
MENLILLSDKNSSSWIFAQKIQEYIFKTKGVSVSLREVQITRFNNGEINIHVPSNVRKKDVFFIQDSSKNPQNWWVELLLVKDLLLRASVKSLSFVLPNMLYSRQDRKDKPRVPISSRALADSICCGVQRIITMDLHANQIQGFYPAETAVDNLYSFPEVVRYLRENYFEDLNNLVVVAPDAGSANRTKAFLSRLEKAQDYSGIKQKYSFALLSKTRSVPGEVGEMQLVGEVEGKNVLLVDDLIDTGGTLRTAAEVLKKHGARKMFCYGTHGVFTKGTKILSEVFDVVLTSNTHYNQNEIKIIDMSPLFAEAIYRAQEGLSISTLFE